MELQPRTPSTEGEKETSRLTERIIIPAIEIHRRLGPGLMESAYEECLCFELSQLGLVFKAVNI